MDTYGCVQDLMTIGVIYPKATAGSQMPPEQQKIFKELMGQ